MNEVEYEVLGATAATLERDKCYNIQLARNRLLSFFILELECHRILYAG